MKKVQLALLAIAILSVPAVYAGSFAILRLQHQSAEDLIPIIKPLVGPQSVITGTGYKLIVKVTPAEYRDIQMLLKELDTPPQQLIVSVTQDQALVRDQQQQSLSGQLGNENANVRFGQRVPHSDGTVRIGDRDDHIRLQAGQRNLQQAGNTEQRVLVLSGRQAFIEVGQDHPVPQQQVTIRGDRAIVTRSTRYHHRQTGFYVLPRVVGDQVTVEISATKQTPDSMSRDRYDTQNISTSVSGKIGEWLEIGTMNETLDRQRSDTFSSRSSASQDKRVIFLKIEKAHADRFRSKPPMYK